MRENNFENIKKIDINQEIEEHNKFVAKLAIQTQKNQLKMQ